MKQVERGHWSNEAKEYYYAKRAAALGVRERQRISIRSNDQAHHLSKNTLIPWGQERHSTQMGRKTERRSCLTQN